MPGGMVGRSAAIGLVALFVMSGLSLAPGGAPPVETASAQGTPNVTLQVPPLSTEPFANQTLGHVIVEEGGIESLLVPEVTWPCEAELADETRTLYATANVVTVRPIQAPADSHLSVSWEVFLNGSSDEKPLVAANGWREDRTWLDASGALADTTKVLDNTPTNQVTSLATATVEIPHQVDPYENTSYDLEFSVQVIWEGPQLDEIYHERILIPIEVLSCDQLPPGDLVQPLEVPGPGFPEPAPVALGMYLPESGALPQATPLSGSDPLPPGEGVSAAFASSYYYYDKRILPTPGSSPCQPPNAVDGLDSTSSHQAAHYRVYVNGPTRLDIYYSDDFYRVWHWWYANIPSAGYWCVTAPQTLFGDRGDEIRGWWHTLAFVNGNGGFMSGNYVPGSVNYYTIEPFVYYDQTTPRDPVCPPFWSSNPSATTYYKTDRRATYVARIYSEHITTTHTFQHRYWNPDGHPHQPVHLDVDPGYWGWEHCHWLWIKGTSVADQPGWWDHWLYDLDSGGSWYTENRMFQLINRDPGSFSLVSPVGGVSKNIPVTLDWSTSTDPDGDTIRYEVYAEVNDAGSWTNVCTTYATLCYPTLPSYSKIDWYVEAHDESWGGTSTQAGPATFHTTGPDSDGDGVSDAVDIDPDHDIQIRLVYRELNGKSPMTKPSVSVEVVNQIQPLTVSENSYTTRFGNAADPDNYWKTTPYMNVRDDLHLIQLNIELREDGKVRDINDAEDYFPNDEKKKCKLILDLRTGFWNGISNSEGDKDWDPLNPREELNNGYGFCAQSVYHESYRNAGGYAFGHYWLQFDIEITDDDGDGMPRRWETDNGLDHTVDNSATDTDLDGFSDYEEWRMRRDPDGPDPGAKLHRSLTFFVGDDASHTGTTALEQFYLQRQLLWTSQFMWDLTDGHLLIQEWTEVSTQAGADVVFNYDGCSGGAPVDGQGPWAHRHGFTGTTSWLNMPLYFFNEGCDVYANHQYTGHKDAFYSYEMDGYLHGQWARTLGHELSHYLYAAEDEYKGPRDVGQGTNGRPEPHHQFHADCWAWRSETLAHTNSPPVGAEHAVMDNAPTTAFSELSGPGDEDILSPDRCEDSWPWDRHNWDYGDGTCDVGTPPAGANAGDPCRWRVGSSAASHVVDGSTWNRMVYWMEDLDTNRADFDITWDFNRDGTIDPPNTINSRFRHFAGPMDPVYDLVEVNFV